MHRFRRQVAYAAWSDSQDLSRSHNSFKKSRSRPGAQSTSRSTTHEGASVQQSHGTPGSRRSLDAGRHEIYLSENELAHAVSAPDVRMSRPTVWSPDSSTRVISPSPERGKQNEAKLTIVPESEEKPRVRGKFKSLFGKPTANNEILVEDDDKKPRVRFTVAGQVKRIFLYSWINVLLLAVPAGFVVRYVIGYSVATFVVNFIAIVPLVLLVSLGADEIQLRVGLTLGGLINVSAR